MDFKLLLEDKSLKPKEKTETLSRWVLDNPKKVIDLIEFAKISILFCWRRNLIRDFLEFLSFPSIIISPGANPKKP